MNGQPATAADADRKTCEVRLGLVMYGGVSLAIYINGAAHEFFRAVRGRGVYKLIKGLTDSDITVDIISGTSAGGINGILLAYALCNEREFPDAASLWRNDGDIRRLLRAPHGDAESTWSLLDSEGYYQPQLEAAFRDMRKIPATDEDVSSFSELDLFVTGTDVDGNRFTQFDDAGHAIDVKDHRSVFHLKHRRGRKQPFDPDFKTAPDQTTAKNREVTFKALAKLARITSCFPGAFSPVTVTNADPDEAAPDSRLQYWGRLGKESCFLDGGLIDNKPFTHTLKEIFFRKAVGNVDRRLFYVEPDPEHWEALEGASQPNFFQAIVASLVGIPGYESISDDLKLLGSHNSKLERHRRVVEFLEAQREIEPPTPQVEKLYKRSRLISLSEWIVRSVLRIQGRYELLSQEARKKAANMVVEFDSFVFEQEGGNGEGEQPDFVGANYQDYIRRLMTAITEQGAGEKALGVVRDFQSRAERAKFSAGQWQRADRILDDFDVNFRLRRAFHTVYFIHRRLGEMKTAVLAGPHDEEDELAERHAHVWGDEDKRTELTLALRYKRVWAALNTQIELYDIVRSAMEHVVDESDFAWREKSEGEIWTEAQHILRHLLNRATDAAKTLPHAPADGERWRWLDGQRLSLFNEKLRALAGDIAKVTKDKGAVAKRGIKYDAEARRIEAPAEFESLLRHVEEQERRIIEEVIPDATDPVRRAYDSFSSLDAKLFPVELVAELDEKDIIRTYRISPHDAKKGFSNKGLSDKVSGDALYHFGGFFKRSWRSNDILWGRLDCLCQLVETLLNPTRMSEVLKNEHLRAKVRDRFYEPAPAGGGARELKQAMSPARLFKDSGSETHRKLEKWLDDLLGEGKDVDAFLDSKEFADGCEALIEAAQYEVLVEDLPSVISDSLQEQVGWNQFRLRKREEEYGDGRKISPEDSPFVFHPPAADLDPFYGVIAAAGQAAEWMEKVKAADGDKAAKPTETRLGKFFREEYKVGTEALLRDMPLLVVLEIFSVSLLVLRNCILNVFDRSKRAVIKSHPLYLVTVDLPLRAFNVLVRFLRRAPRWEKQIFVGACAVSAIIITFTILGRKNLLFENHEFSFFNFALLIGLPAVVIYGSGLYLTRESGKKKSKGGTVLRLFVQAGHALLVLAPLFVFGYYFYLLRKGAEQTSGLPAGAHVYLLLAAFLLAVLGPYLTCFLVSKWLRSFRLEKSEAKLQSVLVDYFSLQEMLLAARRAVADTPFEWSAVQEILSEGAAGDKAREENLARLGELFEGRKFVKWGALRRRLEDPQQGMPDEKWLLSAALNMPLEDDDSALDREKVKRVLAEAGGGANLSRFDRRFKGRELTLGTARRFLHEQKWEAGMKALRERLGEVVEAERTGWPAVEEKQPAGWKDPRRFGVKFTSRGRSWKEWQRQTTAAKIVDWASRSDNLVRLTTHMRFVNPEALYGE